MRAAMIEKLDIDEWLLARQLDGKYSIQVERIIFIPFGDSAYSYQVICRDGQRYYLKLFDRNNDRQLRGIEKLNDYLPILSRMHSNGSFVNLAYPIETVGGDLIGEFSECTGVLFCYKEGDTLAEAYPFPDDIVDHVAQLLARLHTVSTSVAPVALTDTYDISFADELKECISELEHVDSNGDSFLSEVKQQVLGKKDRIYELIDLTCGLRGDAALDASSLVLCHGDVWGGNMIQHHGQLFLIDWESMQVAPRELDFMGYIGEEFERFYAAYTKQLGYAASLNSDILRFYSYRHHLRNLNNWLRNILYRNLDSGQKENDLEMIRAHCMDRWELIEPSLARLEAALQRAGAVDSTM
jgi:spectinomycin phosphotransferase